MTHKKAIELGFSFTNYIYISAGGIKVLLTSVEQSSTTEFVHCFGTLVCPSSRARDATQNHIFPCQCWLVIMPSVDMAKGFVFLFLWKVENE